MEREYNGWEGGVKMAQRSGGRSTGGRTSDSQTARALDEFEQLAGLRRSAYVLEHLATFTVTRETGIVYPADGMRRLLQLEKTNGNEIIWWNFFKPQKSKLLMFILIAAFWYLEINNCDVLPVLSERNTNVGGIFSKRYYLGTFKRSADS